MQKVRVNRYTQPNFITLIENIDKNGFNNDFTILIYIIILINVLQFDKSMLYHYKNHMISLKHHFQ